MIVKLNHELPGSQNKQRNLITLMVCIIRNGKICSLLQGGILFSWHWSLKEFSVSFVWMILDYESAHPPKLGFRENTEVHFLCRSWVKTQHFTLKPSVSVVTAWDAVGLLGPELGRIRIPGFLSIFVIHSSCASGLVTQLFQFAVSSSVNCESCGFGTFFFLMFSDLLIYSWHDFKASFLPSLNLSLSQVPNTASEVNQSGRKKGISFYHSPVF